MMTVQLDAARIPFLLFYSLLALFFFLHTSRRFLRAAWGEMVIGAAVMTLFSDGRTCFSCTMVQPTA
jgi:hypothetical protein